MKQTAVEWLIEKLRENHGVRLDLYDELNKAKEMEKQQIKNTWVNALKDSMINPLEDKYYEPEAEQYYNETFKSE